MLSDSLQALYERASIAIENAYAPYSNHPVGAALITDDGAIFAGANLEAAHYNNIHAEGSAIAAMVVAGKRRIKDIVILGPGEHLCTPCGDCRQRIREFADGQTGIHVYNRRGEKLRSYTINDLLPDSFGPENVAEQLAKKA